MIGDINQLPEDCLSHVIAFTTPRDACVISVVSPAFRSAVDSDATWQHFLPSDCPSILSRAVEPVQYLSKKALFFRLCDHPVLIDGGNMSSGLERSSGAKCFMIAARAMYIVWSEDERYWKWIPLSESRFSEGAELLRVCWLEIRAKIESKILSTQTAYTAHLIFKLDDDSYGLANPLQEASITIGGQCVSNRSLRIQVSDTSGRRRRRMLNMWQWPRFHDEIEETAGDGPRERGDGWMEIDLGEFYNDSNEDDDVEISFLEVKGGDWKKGLVLQGIEIRPKST